MAVSYACTKEFWTGAGKPIGPFGILEKAICTFGMEIMITCDKINPEVPLELDHDSNQLRIILK